MSTKVLVTGANGQLGKTIQELFLKNEDKIDFLFISKSELDITNTYALKEFFRINNFNYCINCAAYTNVEQAETHPEIAFKVNVEAVRELAKSCKTNNIILVHISTDYVFDGKKQEPYTEEDITNPINEYGKTKLKGEEHIQAIMNTFYIVRTSWLYSKKYGSNFYKTVLNKARSKKKLKITTSQVGCPTNTESLAKFIVNSLILKKPNYGVYHFCDQAIMTWYDFASQILKENNLISSTVLAKDNNYTTFAKRPNYSVLRSTKN